MIVKTRGWAKAILSASAGAVISWAAVASAEEPAVATATDADLVTWVEKNGIAVYPANSTAKDRRKLKALIGDARIVSLGEAIHGAAEPLEFRNWLFQSLAQDFGFTAIAIESGLTDSYPANHYVQGGDGDAAEIAQSSITFGLGAFPQQAALLSWMRDFNAAHDRELDFFGMDVSSTPAEDGSGLEAALAYLNRVAPDATETFRSRLAPHMGQLKIGRMEDDPGHYAYLAETDRDMVSALIADLITSFEINEGAYIEATSARDYALAYRAAISARHSDAYLRQFPYQWTPQSGPVFSSVAVADRAKTENIEWILDQQGPGGKIMLFAHDGHAATTPVTIRLGPDTELSLPPMFGRYLPRRYGEALLTIGHLAGAAAMACDGSEAQPAPADSLEGVLSKARKGAFLIDLRDAPDAIKRRFDIEHPLFGLTPVHSMNLAEGFDVIYFTQLATRAAPCPEPKTD